MALFIKAKLNKYDGETNIDNCNIIISQNSITLKKVHTKYIIWTLLYFRLEFIDALLSAGKLIFLRIII